MPAPSGGDGGEGRKPMAQVPRPTRIQEIQEASREWFALLAGAQLDLFTPLADGPMRAGELARVP